MAEDKHLQQNWWKPRMIKSMAAANIGDRCTTTFKKLIAASINIL